MSDQTRIFCTIATATFLVACGAANAASNTTDLSGDPITALCISYGDRADICECATDSFRASVPEAEIYAEIAALFLSDTDPEKDKTGRWEDAQQVVLVDHQRTEDKHLLNNRFGRGHRAAIDFCRD